MCSLTVLAMSSRVACSERSLLLFISNREKSCVNEPLKLDDLGVRGRGALGGGPALCDRPSAALTMPGSTVLVMKSPAMPARAPVTEVAGRCLCLPGLISSGGAGAGNGGSRCDVSRIDAVWNACTSSAVGSVGRADPTIEVSTTEGAASMSENQTTTTVANNNEMELWEMILSSNRALAG